MAAGIKSPYDCLATLDCPIPGSSDPGGTGVADAGQHLPRRRANGDGRRPRRLAHRACGGNDKRGSARWLGILQSCCLGHAGSRLLWRSDGAGLRLPFRVRQRSALGGCVDSDARVFRHRLPASFPDSRTFAEYRGTLATTAGLILSIHSRQFVSDRHRRHGRRPVATRIASMRASVD